MYDRCYLVQHLQHIKRWLSQRSMFEGIRRYHYIDAQMCVIYYRYWGSGDDAGAINVHTFGVISPQYTKLLHSS